MPLIPFYAARRSLLRFADGLRAVDFFKAVAVIFGVGLLSAAWAESPDIAGRVQFVVGEVSAADRDGATRALGKRDDIFEGDTVTTGPSASAQIMMIDGARIAVRPNSAFMVNEYRAPSADDIGASILTLLKGGFRTLSGLIGEESARYRIDTPCCSIGLRGTDHAVFHIPEGEENAYGGGEAGTYNRVYKGATFLESAGVTLDITPQTDAGFAARGQPPVFVPDIPETAEGAVVLAPSEDEDEESDDSEAAENESEESESEDESESETETADADDSNSEAETAETADADDSNSETETAEPAETADADDSNSGSDDAVLAESPADESSSEIDDAVIVESPADESSSEIDDAVIAESPADESSSEIDNAGLAESPADESSSEIDNAGLVESPGEFSSALETVEIAIESAAPPIADFQNPADIADALQRENTMPEPEPPSPVISLTSDLTMLQEGRQVILRVSSDIPARPGGLMVTINIGTAMAGEFGIAGGDCTALECVVLIPAGMLAAALTITPISDTAMESAERWTATLGDGGLNYNIDNTMMAVGFDISDQPVIGIATADMAIVREGGEIRLTVSSDIAAPAGGLMVTINIGTAMAGEFGIAGGDCTALECVVLIPAGMLAATLTITPISDTAMESAERWTATLGDGGLNYNIDNTMMAVGFDISDQPVIGIATADMAMVREGGEIRLTVSSDIAAPSGGLMVTINIGTAMAGEFGISGGVCSALECVVTIPAGMLAATLTITPISDSVIEDLENWMATLGDGGLNYNIDNTMMNVGFDISDPPNLNLQQNVGTEVGEHDIALQWEAHPDATGYRVFRRGTEIGDVTGTSFTHSLQMDGDSGDHHYRIVPYDSNRNPIFADAADILASRADDFGNTHIEWDAVEGAAAYRLDANISICCVAAASYETDIPLDPYRIFAYRETPNGDLELLGLSRGGTEIRQTPNGIEWDPVAGADLYEISISTVPRTRTSINVLSADVPNFGFRSEGHMGFPSGYFIAEEVIPEEVTNRGLEGLLRNGNLVNIEERRMRTTGLPADSLIDPASLVGGSLTVDPNFPVGLEFETFPIRLSRNANNTANNVIIASGQPLGEQQFSAIIGGVEYPLLNAGLDTLGGGRSTSDFFRDVIRLDQDSIWILGGGSGHREVRFPGHGLLALVLEGPSFASGGVSFHQLSQVEPFLFYRLEVGDRVILRNYYLSMLVDDFFMGVTNVEDVALTGPETFFRVVGGADCRLSSGVRCSKQSGGLGVEGLASFGLGNDGDRAFTRFDLQRNDGNRISGRYFSATDALRPLMLPPMPENLSGESDLLGVNLSWDESAGADYYKIFRDGVEIGLALSIRTCAGNSLFGCVDVGAMPGATHRYTISAVDNFGRESPMSDPLELTIPADIPPPFDSLAEPDDWIIGGATGIMAMRLDSDVLAAGEQFSAFAPADGSYVGFRIGDATANSRVVVFRTDRDGTGGFSAAGAQINDFDFSYAIETGAVNVLTDYNVRIDLNQGGGNEIWDFGLDRRVNLDQAETDFGVSGSATIGSSTHSAFGDASFGTDNANVYSRFDVGSFGISDARLLGQFSVPATPTP